MGLRRSGRRHGVSSERWDRNWGPVVRLRHDGKLETWNEGGLTSPGAVESVYDPAMVTPDVLKRLKNLRKGSDDVDGVLDRIGRRHEEKAISVDDVINTIRNEIPNFSKGDWKEMWTNENASNAITLLLSSHISKRVGSTLTERVQFRLSKDRDMHKLIRLMLKEMLPNEAANWEQLSPAERNSAVAGALTSNEKLRDRLEKVIIKRIR